MSEGQIIQVDMPATEENGNEEKFANSTTSIRGKSETVHITSEELQEDLKEEEEKMEASKTTSDVVKKLFLSDKMDEQSDTNETKVKAPEEYEEEEILQKIATMPLEWFKNMKNVPDAIAKIYYKDISRRWEESELRIKDAETLLSSVKYEDRSLEEDRLEILGELLDKATQSFEIFYEHEKHKIPYGHRVVLESRLLMVFNDAVNLIFKIIGEFDKLKGDQVGVNDERDQLRYEIRNCDHVYTEVHERFLKSYLELKW
ncbi:unnamed protein product [Thelazia callipaeda]|uniref:Uncharacterized protein n=1 Tax=Thelazia callipaeda TaxID=103827 RepID=A0A0N5D1R9_THECL|nr:unnamed protein product [Thelazia callipaeda]